MVRLRGGVPNNRCRNNKECKIISLKAVTPVKGNFSCISRMKPASEVINKVRVKYLPSKIVNECWR